MHFPKGPIACKASSLCGVRTFLITKTFPHFAEDLSDIGLAHRHKKQTAAAGLYNNYYFHHS
jgi:hypothetical protein